MIRWVIAFAATGALFAPCARAQEVPAPPPVVQAPSTPEQPPVGEEKKEKLPPKGVIHLQQVKDPPSVHALQACTNYSFAASLEAVLAYQHVDLKQDYWVDKYYGGSLCLDAIGDLDDLIKKTEGEYTLDDGRHVQLTLQYFPGLPSNTSALLVPIMSNQIQIVFLDGHADLLTGAMWDDWQSKSGERMIDLKELHLLDPLKEGDQQEVVLTDKDDGFSRITGFMKVNVEETRKQYWPTPASPSSW